MKKDLILAGWKYRKGISKNTFYIETVDNEHSKTFIAEVGGGLHTPEEIEANAKLISAAPHLLYALIICYQSLLTYGSHPIIEKSVEIAFKKAGLPMSSLIDLVNDFLNVSPCELEKIQQENNTIRKLGISHTIGELKRLIEPYADDTSFGFRNQPMQELFEVKNLNDVFVVFQ